MQLREVGDGSKDEDENEDCYNDDTKDALNLFPDFKKRSEVSFNWS